MSSYRICTLDSVNRLRTSKFVRYIAWLTQLDQALQLRRTACDQGSAMVAKNRAVRTAKDNASSRGGNFTRARVRFLSSNSPCVLFQCNLQSSAIFLSQPISLFVRAVKSLQDHDWSGLLDIVDIPKRIPRGTGETH